MARKKQAGKKKPAAKAQTREKPYTCITELVRDYKAFTELHDMVGLEDVKKEVVSWANLNLSKNLSNRSRKNVEDGARGIVLYGPPGVGKSCLAKALAGALHAMGLSNENFASGTAKSLLVAEFEGQSTAKTIQLFKENDGGVIFLDEAYELSSVDKKGGYENEALTELMKCMDDYSKTTVIVAGYRQDMEEKLFKSNPGLKRRFETEFNLKPFSPSELVEILVRKVKAEGLEMEEKAKNWLAKQFATPSAQKMLQDQNAGAMKTLLDKAHAKLANEDLKANMLQKKHFKPALDAMLQTHQSDTEVRKLCLKPMSRQTLQTGPEAGFALNAARLVEDMCDGVKSVMQTRGMELTEEKVFPGLQPTERTWSRDRVVSYVWGPDQHFGWTPNKNPLLDETLSTEADISATVVRLEISKEELYSGDEEDGFTTLFFDFRDENTPRFILYQKGTVVAHSLNLKQAPRNAQTWINGVQKKLTAFACTPIQRLLGVKKEQEQELRAAMTKIAYQYVVDANLTQRKQLKYTTLKQHIQWEGNKNHLLAVLNAWIDITCCKYVEASLLRLRKSIDSDISIRISKETTLADKDISVVNNTVEQIRRQALLPDMHLCFTLIPEPEDEPPPESGWLRSVKSTFNDKDVIAVFLPTEYGMACQSWTTFNPTNLEQAAKLWVARNEMNQRDSPVEFPEYIGPRGEKLIAWASEVDKLLPNEDQQKSKRARTE